jgi:asparagine synthase (glutamine-hydrolysing)
LLYNSSFLDPEFVQDLVANDLGDDLSYRKSCLRETSEKQLDRVSRLSLLDQQNYLVSILERQDKMSMAASIESRVPFLDYRIVEFANNLPVRFKTRRFQTKAILKQVARKFLPASVVDRRKSGFGVPLKSWLGDPRGLGRYVDELQDDRVMARYVNREKAAELIAQHKAGHADHSEFLWTAINFMIWTKGVRQ